jgi:hypothetical protein
MDLVPLVATCPRRCVCLGYAPSSAMLALTLWGLAVVIWGSVDSLLPSRSTLLLPASPEIGAWGSLLLVLAGTLLGRAAITGQTRVMYILIVGCTWLAMLMTVVWVYTPQFNHRYPIKSFAVEVHAHVALGRPLQLCGPMNDLALRFNLGRFVPELHQSAEVMHYLEGMGRPSVSSRPSGINDSASSLAVSFPSSHARSSIVQRCCSSPTDDESSLKRQCRTTSGVGNC